MQFKYFNKDFFYGLAVPENILANTVHYFLLLEDIDCMLII